MYVYYLHNFDIKWKIANIVMSVLRTVLRTLKILYAITQGGTSIEY